jgi:predicted nucleotidyltransferase
VGELLDRRAQTSNRVDKLRADLADAEALATGKACVYVTGSFGRGEASQHSDLDLFILGKKAEEKGPGGRERSALKRLDDICIKAALIRVTRAQGIPEFSGDGEYLGHYSVYDLIKTLGMPEDDVTNTFTARLLLVLESAPLLGKSVYDEVIAQVIDEYWRDYEDHKSEFIPAFLANDVLRLWRTFCVNYEARTAREPTKANAKRKLKNYKLKHSRLLTCYSGLLYLLAIYVKEKTVRKESALSMISITPTQRLEWLREQDYLAAAKNTIESLLKQYEEFLSKTNAKEDELIDIFMDKERSRPYFEDAYKFGDLVFRALNLIGGEDNRFHRLLVV